MGVHRAAGPSGKVHDQRARRSAVAWLISFENCGDDGNAVGTPLVGDAGTLSGHSADGKDGRIWLAAPLRFL